MRDLRLHGSWASKAGTELAAIKSVGEIPRATAVLLAGLGTIGGFYLLPEAGIAQAVELCLVNLSAAAFALLAAFRARGLARTVWLGLAAGQTLALIANVPYYAYPLLTGRRLPFPTVVDGFFLATYPAYGLALWALAKLRHGADTHGDLLDALIVFLGGGSVMWTFAVAPALRSTGLSALGHVVAPLYPIMDLALFAMLARLLVGSWQNGAIRWIVASFTALLTADLVYQIMLGDGTFHIGGPPDGLWMLSYVLIAAAARHPAASSLGKAAARRSHRITAGRLVFLAPAVLVGPMLMATRPQDAVVLACTSALTALLVMARMAILNRRLAAARLAVEQKSAELLHQALHDGLTGLPNRVLVMDRIQRLLAANRRSGNAGAALFVDLDGFKNVNDTLGHAAGDRLLQAIAKRLTASTREVDTVGRMGGDEFIVLVDGAPTQFAPELVAERIVEVMRQPFNIDNAGPPITITASVGLAVAAGQSPGDLLRQADLALYEAKAAGRNRLQVFSHPMEAATQRRFDLTRDLLTAVEGGQFTLVYQPIYRLGDLALTGVEALLRWLHPTLGQIQPDEFIPLLESSGEILEVGQWVLNHACAQMAEWRKRGHDLSVSVNLSARQLESDQIDANVADALEDCALDPSALTLEITETTLMRDVDTAARRLCDLKALGVQIAVDDFGTGYSSLAYLQRFPVDRLKIDRAFTEAVIRSPESRALVHTLAQLGRDLGLTTLAEGVETADQIQYLRSEHVDEVQGFLLARPLDANTIEQEILEPAAMKRPFRELRSTSNGGPGARSATQPATILPVS